MGGGGAGACKYKSGIKFFILDSRRAPHPPAPLAGIKPHLKSKFCAILKKRGAMLEFEVDVLGGLSRLHTEACSVMYDTKDRHGL